MKRVRDLTQINAIEGKLRVKLTGIDLSYNYPSLPNPRFVSLSKFLLLFSFVLLQQELVQRRHTQELVARAYGVFDLIILIDLRISKQLLLL